MIVCNKCVEKATGSIIVLILTDERECCRWEGPLIARVTAGLAALAGLNNPINPHIVSSLDLTKPRVNGLYPVTTIPQTYYASPSERERSINRFMESYLIMSRITIKF